MEETIGLSENQENENRIEPSIYRYVLQHTKKDQVLLLLLTQNFLCWITVQDAIQIINTLAFSSWEPPLFQKCPARHLASSPFCSGSPKPVCLNHDQESPETPVVTRHAQNVAKNLSLSLAVFHLDTN